ncbi:MAG: 8-amino-7-oxononanoate synthase [Desulfocapsaceae bacterium]|nr:8-amino-7-oxononanoate synthase [Desulfocapsaceae bacterium]
MLNLTSNDYLGLAANKKIHKEFYQSLDDGNLIDNYGLGSASSRLLTGDSYLAHDLEELIGRHYGRPACLLFNSGYHANIGILPTLARKNDLILSDKLNHASIHDGMRLSRAAFKRFRHRDYDHLADLLKDNRKKYETVFIVTESVFSMDGDEADLQILVEMKKRFDCLLYVDEAHGVGVHGEKGLGKVEQHDVIDEVDLIVGTFGKAYASIGAYVLCNTAIKEFLINSSRSLIFTTALPPVVIHWNGFIFKRALEMSQERRKLMVLADTLRDALYQAGLETAGSTNIVPVIIGENQQTVTMAEQMQDQGFLIFAVRPPTVPEGTARFRLSLTAAMQWHDIEHLPQRITQTMDKL